MAKQSGSTRAKIPSGNPQFKGVTNKETQSSHHAQMYMHNDVVKYISEITGITDRDTLDEMRAALFYYTGEDSYDIKRSQGGFDAFLEPYINAVKKIEKKKNKELWARDLEDARKTLEQKRTQYEYYRKMADYIEQFIDRAPKWNGGTTFRGIKIDASEIDKFKVLCFQVDARKKECLHVYMRKASEWHFRQVRL